MKGYKIRIAGIVFSVLVIGFGILPRCGEVRVSKSWLEDNTSEYKIPDISDELGAAQFSLNTLGVKINLKDWVHLPSNNIILPNTKNVVGEEKIKEKFLNFHFGQKVYKKGKKKGEPKEDKDGNPIPLQKIPFALSFGFAVKQTYEDVRDDYNGGELDIIKGYRSGWEQFVGVYIRTLGEAGPAPLQGRSSGSHQIGRAVDFYASFMNNDVPLGKVDGEIVIFGTRPKKQCGVKCIKPNPDTKELVLKWIEEVRFEEEFDVLEKLPGYNREKCLEHAYEKVRWLIAANLEGAHMIAFEYAKKHGLTGAACTKAKLKDAGHYSEIESALIDHQEKMTEEERKRMDKRADKISIYRNCHRGSEKWNDYYYRSAQSADPSLKWSKTYDEALKKTAPGLILFPPNKCTDK